MLGLGKPQLFRSAIPVTLLEKAVSVEDSLRETAEKAQKVLHHNSTLAALDQAKTSNAVQLEVGKVFEKLGFEPLDMQQVRKYQNWFAKKYSNEFERVSWVSARLESGSYDSYSKVVPAFALSRALEMKEHLPSATFAVEYPHATKIPPDPFLRMDYKGLSFILEVWDEPEFEGRRVI